MPRRWTLTVVSLSCVAALVVAHGALHSDTPPPAPAQAPAGAAPPTLVQGLAGCTARGCHGGELPHAKIGEFGTIDFQASSPNAGTLWLRHDPHANAYSVLAEDKAEKMMRLLAGPDGKVKHAYEEERCLACHATPTAAHALATVGTRQPDAFGCEACHGAAQKWLIPHQTHSFPLNWDKPGDSLHAAYDTYGMTWLNDAHSRAHVCVGCHVGAPADPKTGSPLRDMNHDMIAAGYPRLTFEYASYLRNLPRHWEERNRAESGLPSVAPSPINDWLAGQEETLQAGLALLAHRATRRELGGLVVDVGEGDVWNFFSTPPYDFRSQVPWPEFSEYDCFSCHGDLGGRNSPALDLGTRKPGSLVWNRWYWSLPFRQLAGSGDLDNAYKALATELSNRSPDRKKVSEAVAIARTALTKSKVHLDGPRTLLKAAGAGEQLVPWDDAAQLYYAWAAAAASQPGLLSKAEPSLRAFRDRLRFPPKMNSPEANQPIKIVAPMLD
jgi:hypothetical protein